MQIQKHFQKSLEGPPQSSCRPRGCWEEVDGGPAEARGPLLCDSSVMTHVVIGV